jgi:hypothetical protein
MRYEHWLGSFAAGMDGPQATMLCVRLSFHKPHYTIVMRRCVFIKYIVGWPGHDEEYVNGDTNRRDTNFTRRGKMKGVFDNGPDDLTLRTGGLLARASHYI